MKKYQRLILIIISVLSLSLFLVYRHHYNQLRHVLEVFNFFGTPCNFSELQQSETVLMEHDWGPQPLWQEIDNKEYIYNAFLVEKNRVVGLGVRPINTSSPKTCLIHSEDETKPLKGKFSVVNLKDDTPTGLLLYKFTCTFLKGGKSPYSIEFKSQNKLKHIVTPINNNLNSKLVFNTTACVIPGNFSEKLILEFLSFHTMFGVDSFIFYFEQNIPYMLIKLLKNLSRSLNMWITFLPYNMPYNVPNSFTNNLIEYDCHLRAKTHSKHSIVLGIKEYLVPSVDSKVETLRIPIKKFCLNHVNKNRPMILQNFEAIDDYNFNEVRVATKNYFGGTNSSVKLVPNIFQNNCVIHRYEKCEKGVKTKTDTYVKKFSTDFTRSTLVQLLIHRGNDLSKV